MLFFLSGNRELPTSLAMGQMSQIQPVFDRFASNSGRHLSHLASISVKDSYVSQCVVGAGSEAFADGTLFQL